MKTKTLNMVAGLALALLPAMATAATQLPGHGTNNPVKALVGGTVVNLEGGSPITDAVVLIEGERIKSVGPRASVAVPEGAEVIDASGKWIMPGLMNMHVHLALKLPGAASMALQHESESEQTLRVAKNAWDTLYSGTTTIRSPGDNGRADIALNRAIQRGDFDGPRIFSGGIPIAATGGHGTEPGQDGIDGPDQVTKAVRTEIREGASWIKLMISRGIASPAGSIAASDMTFAEMKAATDVAGRHGVKVTAHSGSPLATMEALDAGVICFEHGYFLTEDVFRKMKAKDAWYVPTIVVSQAGAMEFFKKIGSPQWYLDRAKSVGTAHWAALQTAIRTKVNIAMGSDQFPFEPNEGTVASVREIELYEEAGMTPVQALRSATVMTAKLLDISNDAGTVSPGKYADLIMMTEDPAKSTRALRTLGFVMKGGKVYRNDWAR